MAQLVMIDQFLVAERDADDALRQQRAHIVLDVIDRAPAGSFGTPAAAGTATVTAGGTNAKAQFAVLNSQSNTGSVSARGVQGAGSTPASRSVAAVNGNAVTAHAVGNYAANSIIGK